MHIALFTDHDPGSGCETTLAAMARHRPTDTKLTCYASPRGLRGLQLREIAARIERERVDVVHLATPGPWAVAALSVAWRLRIPVVGSFDATLGHGTWIQTQYFRALCRRCACLFVPSALALGRMVDASVSREALVQWRPGVDGNTFGPSRQSVALRERWQVSESRPAVIYVGRLSESHGARRLLSLETALRRSNPMHRLIVVGDGPSRAELEARCSRAIFLGSVAHESMPEILASADLFVSPGERDSAAHSVLEAQASGLPCVVMESGSARERISPASPVVCRSVVDLIIETASIVRDRARRKGMGVAAREHALRQDWASGLAPLYAAYRKAVEVSGARRDLRPALVSQGRRL